MGFLSPVSDHNLFHTRNSNIDMNYLELFKPGCLNVNVFTHFYYTHTHTNKQTLSISKSSSLESKMPPFMLRHSSSGENK